MAYKIVLTKTFERSLKKCNKDVAQRIIRELSVLEYDRGGVIKMRYTPKHLKGLHKYRIGEWRVESGECSSGLINGQKRSRSTVLVTAVRSIDQSSMLRV